MAGSLYLGSQRVCPATLFVEKSERYGIQWNNIIGDVDENGVLQATTTCTGLSFDGVKSITSEALRGKFKSGSTPISISGPVVFPDLETVNCDNALRETFYEQSNITSASFPKLRTVQGNSCFDNMFTKDGFDNSNLSSISMPLLTSATGDSCFTLFLCGTGITSVSFPNLETISGYEACYDMFMNCFSLEEVRFTALKTMEGEDIFWMPFLRCWKLKDLYFNSLTTSSFTDTTVFSGLMRNMSQSGNEETHTIHFPSNLEITIQGLSGYPNFGGTNGKVVLAFDLPETE